MEVPFRLTRRESAASVDAALLCTADRGRIAQACVQLGGSRLPEVFAVRGGFLLIPREQLTKPPADVVRLRRLAGDLFIPIDAELLPSLLPEESTALTRDRGLVVLPSGEVLAFDPDSPLTADEWLMPGRIRSSEWRPFPTRPTRPDSLTVIERPAPPVEIIVVLSGGQPDGANPLPGAGTSGTGAVPEDARPQAGSPAARVREGMRLGMGRFLTWLGRAISSNRLAQAGANMARQAIERVPRLSERVLGEQEAALREVLRQLQAGDVERALRRAPIAVADPNARGNVGTNANLGVRDPRYSLRHLIGTGSGGGTAWLGGGNVWEELAREYRRLAAEAQAKGDFRRAAYLHGVLLRDLRSAANSLMAGGLFRDAALLFRDRLNDNPAAADAFEKAGDYDEAIRILEKLERYEQVGDLYRKLGDDDRADNLFTLAAEVHAKHGRWLSAAALIHTKIGDHTKTRAYLRRGWDAGGTESVACATRLLDELGSVKEYDEFKALCDEAEAHFAPPRTHDAAKFFNHALCVANLPHPLRENLADRTRLLFASHLRALSTMRANDVVSELFGRGVWGASVVRDATFATRKPEKRPAPLEPLTMLIRGTVVAVTVARDTGDVFVGTNDRIVRWCVRDGRIDDVGRYTMPRLLGLSTDPDGKVLYSLHGTGNNLSLICARESGRQDFHNMSRHDMELPAADHSGCTLHPALFQEGEYRIMLALPRGYIRFSGWYLKADPLTEEVNPPERQTHLLLGSYPDANWNWTDTTMRYSTDATVSGFCRWVVPWQPRVPHGSSLALKPIDFSTATDDILEVVGLDAVGNVYWSEFDGRNTEHPRSRTAVGTHADTYRAACLIGQGLVAAVTAKNELHWLRVTINSQFAPWSTPRSLSVPARVAVVVSRPQANEVVVIFEDGTAARVPRP